MENKKTLSVDINFSPEQVEQQTKQIVNSINKVGKGLTQVNTTVNGIFANLNFQAEATAKKLQEKADKIAKKLQALKYFQETGMVDAETASKQVKKGRTRVFTRAKSNIALSAEMGDPYFTKVLTEQIRLNHELKLAKIEIEKTLGIRKEETLEEYRIRREKEIIRHIQEKNIDNEIKLKHSLIKVKDETKKVVNETKKAEKSTGFWLTKFAKIGLTVGVAKRIGSTLAHMVQESGSWIENLNLFEVTFGQNYRKYLDWSVNFAQNLGFSVNQMVKFTGLFKQLSTSIGIAQQTGDKLAKTLTALGTDITSFYNLQSITQAMEKLQAGIYSGRVLPHSKVIYCANSFNSRKLFTTGYCKDNLEQRLEMVA